MINRDNRKNPSSSSLQKPIWIQAINIRDILNHGGVLLELMKELPLSLFSALSPAELTRYERQMNLPEWGLTAQQKFKNSRVFIASASGPMITAALNLAAAGVGRLKVVDCRRVLLTDLCNQMLYREKDLNKFRVAVAQQRLRETNPFIEVEAFERKISDHNALRLIEGTDLILADLRDKPTSLALNRAASRRRLPLIVGWIQNMRCNIITLQPGKGLCLECTGLHDRVRDNEASLGPMSTLAGSLIALETMRLLGGLEPAFLGQLFGFDGNLCRCETEKLKVTPTCPVCGKTF